MTDEEIRLEAAKMSTQCFIANNSDRVWNTFSINVTIIYDYIKHGILPENNCIYKEILQKKEVRKK